MSVGRKRARRRKRSKRGTEMKEPASSGGSRPAKASSAPSSAPVSRDGVEEKTAKEMPVTLLSGFLGSGKTSLMRHILQNKEGLRVAVIMNEITEVNLDAMALEGSKLLKQEEKLVEMANGCICCTLREDLLVQLRELARSGDFDAVLIESSGIAEPMQVAETFFVDLEDGNDQLQWEAPLDNCVTVIDASMVEEYMESLETIDALDPTADASAEGQQDIAALLFAQLEFANVVLLNKVDLLGKSKRERSKNEARLAAIVKKINPEAEVIGTQQGRAPLSKILRTGNFSVEFANGVSNWMEDIKRGVKHVPETLEYGVSGFYWTADLPFHPKRLYDWFVKYFALKQVVLGDNGEEVDDVVDESDEEDGDEIIDERKACLEQYGNLFRSKGFVWIAGEERGKHNVQWQQAGSILSFEPIGLQSKPPGQKLTFVGQYLKHDVLKTDLESLLMTPAELEQLRSDIEAGNANPLEDPFEVFPNSWPEERDRDEAPERRRSDSDDEERALPKKAPRKRK
ncbi:hypothetical protein CTAYLR_006477 [Chrysophaeum taylorii]|uniref:CobW C-terminal domain-containing protein n=1 Tax=Chrysophaeum taylorii TaxID=2483200 RepID=A0AAD7XQL6_9STRA|nr:hypothetical protein CTAYLR_006477 [Chrysophaeum taylorii]